MHFHWSVIFDVRFSIVCPIESSSSAHAIAKPHRFDAQLCRRPASCRQAPTSHTSQSDADKTRIHFMKCWYNCPPINTKECVLPGKKFPYNSHFCFSGHVFPNHPVNKFPTASTHLSVISSLIHTNPGLSPSTRL